MLFEYADRNLILTGYTGPNQPIIGEQVAGRLKLRFVNVDTLVEQRAGGLAESFANRFGETRLKILETGVLQDVALNRGALIRMSGQTLLRAEFAERLQETGPIFCLVASLDAVLQRLHLAMGGRYHNPNERALALGHLRREWAVRKLPGVHEIDVTYMNEAEMVEHICSRWAEVTQGFMPFPLSTSDSTNGSSRNGH
jgi:shikimate kinase